MSSLENELKLLQEKEWTEIEKKMVNSLIENIKYYRKLIPNAFKKDICLALQMCNELKIELDEYREYFKDNNIDINDYKQKKSSDQIKGESSLVEGESSLVEGESSLVEGES